MSHKVVFFTGAGISVDSGIPTFQEQEGIRDKLTRDFCMDNYEEYIENIKSMKRTMNKGTTKCSSLCDCGNELSCNYNEH